MDEPVNPFSDDPAREVYQTSQIYSVDTDMEMTLISVGWLDAIMACIMDSFADTPCTSGPYTPTILVASTTTMLRGRII